MQSRLSRSSDKPLRFLSLSLLSLFWFLILPYTVSKYKIYLFYYFQFLLYIFLFLFISISIYLTQFILFSIILFILLFKLTILILLLIENFYSFYSSIILSYSTKDFKLLNSRYQVYKVNKPISSLVSTLYISLGINIYLLYKLVRSI